MFLCNKLSSFFSLFEVILISLSIFPNNASIFPKKPLIFPKNSSFSGKVWEKACSKIGVFYWLFVNILRFFLVFPMLRELPFYFSQEMPDFSQNSVFSGKLWEKHCFALFSAVLLQRRRNKTTLKWFGALETSSYIYIICILRL